MHHCLQIPEVLQLIFEQAHGEGSDVENRKAVSALSLACKSFHEVGSPILWSSLFSLHPLIKCMPSDSWLVEEPGTVDHMGNRVKHLRFTRHPDAANWDRFQAKAEQVLSFSYGCGRDPDLDEEAFKLLSLYRPPTSLLLPKLQELSWHEPDENVFAYVHLFLGPSLVRLDLYMPPSITLLRPLMRSLHFRSPLLQTLSIKLSWFAGSDQVISQAVCTLRNLREFSLTLPIAEDAVAHLATLPDLTVAHFFPDTLDDEAFARIYSPDAPFFSVVQMLHIDGIQLGTTVTHLVEHVKSRQLSSVRISYVEAPLQGALRDLLSALSHHPSRETLTEIHLVFPLAIYPAPPPVSRPQCMINLPTLHPLLAITSLQDLEISSFYLDLDNAAIDEIARALPHLSSLKLLPVYSRNTRTPKVTLEGLVPLFEHCHDLAVLGIAVDATIPMHYDETLPGGRIFASRLRRLLVADSPIADPDAVAAFLSAFCTTEPLEIVFGCPRVFDAENRHHKAMWAQVCDLIRRFAMVRRQERNHYSNNSRTDNYAQYEPP